MDGGIDDLFGFMGFLELFSSFSEMCPFGISLVYFFNCFVVFFLSLIHAVFLRTPFILGWYITPPASIKSQPPGREDSTRYEPASHISTLVHT